MIRPADEADLATLQQIERAAGRRFAEIGMAEIAADEPPSAEVLDDYRRGGRAWVWDDGQGRAAGYALADRVDGHGHLEQVSVLPEYAGRRIGSALVDHVAQWARGQGAARLTLTTFADVPWNAPYYERLGFVLIPEPEWSPGLRAIRAAEAAHGLDRWPRVCLSRPL